MPSTAIVPLQLEANGGAATFEPARVSLDSLRLTFTGGANTIGPGGDLTLEALDLARLARLDQMFPIAGNETATIKFQRHWQTTMERIETAINSLNAQVNSNTVLLAKITAAQTKADAANDNANEVGERQSIADSYTSPVSVVTAQNDGSISIAAHTRKYGNGSSVSVDAGSVSGFTAGNYVTVYYKDAGREGGAVSYQATTSAVAQQGDTHVVGQATIPASGEPPASGNSPSAPGYSPPSTGTDGPADYIEP